MRARGPEVPAPVEGFLKALVVCRKAVALYPPASTIPRDTATQALEALSAVLREQPELRIIVSKPGLYYNDVPLMHSHPAYGSFALELYSRKIAEVRFHAGGTIKELISFLSLLNHPPEEIDAAGGVETILWDAGVGTITVLDAHVTIVDSNDVVTAQDAAALPDLTVEEIESMLVEAYGGRPRDKIMLARFIGDSASVGSYIEHVLKRTEGAMGLSEASERFAELAEIVFNMAPGPERDEMLSSLRIALSGLDPAVRRSLLVDHLLPEARTNEAVAAVLQDLDLDEICGMLVPPVAGGTGTNDGLARAIRNLSVISAANRDQVMDSARSAMTSAGFSDDSVGEVLELANPSKLSIRESLASAQQLPEQPVDAIFRLMDAAPGAASQPSFDEDPELLALREEAGRGITDGDVIMAMVTLAVSDAREVPFATTMSMLEDSLDLLIERGDIDIAADAADAVRAAMKDPQFSQEQSQRLERAIGRFTKPGDVRAVAQALRLYPAGSIEHDAARRLLDAMGSLAIEPLLEQLADEPDMTARKGLVDLLSKMAPRYIADLGGQITDPRWYVVRNVVSILGSTHLSAVLPYLERTVRHPEPRVRRETIRALSGIHDRIATEMLVAALYDDDASNVQQAARYLGASGTAAAIPVLEQVARGEGRGNREAGPRIEAIEALGRMRAYPALPTLELIAGKRIFRNAGRAKEIRAAAGTAIERIKTGSGGAR